MRQLVNGLIIGMWYAKHIIDIKIHGKIENSIRGKKRLGAGSKKPADNKKRKEEEE